MRCGARTGDSFATADCLGWHLVYTDGEWSFPFFSVRRRGGHQLRGIGGGVQQVPPVGEGVAGRFVPRTDS